MCRLSWNLGASTYWNPQGLSRSVMGLLYFIIFLSWTIILMASLYRGKYQRWSLCVCPSPQMFPQTVQKQSSLLCDYRTVGTVRILNLLKPAHTVFMCFVFIWEQTETCATYSIKWLVFITEMKNVYSAVRTGSLNKAVCASSLNGYLRTNSELCHLQHKLIGFYNRGGKCLQRGTDWVFK
jgi:hypothetical protein